MAFSAAEYPSIRAIILADNSIVVLPEAIDLEEVLREAGLVEARGLVAQQLATVSACQILPGSREVAEGSRRITGGISLRRKGGMVDYEVKAEDRERVERFSRSSG